MSVPRVMSASAARSVVSNTMPVGLCGEFTRIIRVRGVTASATRAQGTVKPPPSVGGFIQADPASNSLVITAPEPLYRQVRALIEQLDTRRAQVYIESMIVEVSGDNVADIALRNTISGEVAIWAMNGTNLTPGGNVLAANPGLAWNLVG